MGQGKGKSTFDAKSPLVPIIFLLQVVVSVEHFIVICGHSVFLILTRPAAHNKNFPYHVRTTQIGIMEAMTTGTTLGPNSLDRFANGGTYGVSATSELTKSLHIFGASLPYCSL